MNIFFRFTPANKNKILEYYNNEQMAEHEYGLGVLIFVALWFIWIW